MRGIAARGTSHLVQRGITLFVERLKPLVQSRAHTPTLAKKDDCQAGSCLHNRPLVNDCTVSRAGYGLEWHCATSTSGSRHREFG
jgi:hypothetical protein